MAVRQGWDVTTSRLTALFVDVLLSRYCTSYHLSRDLFEYNMSAALDHLTRELTRTTPPRAALFSRTYLGLRGMFLLLATPPTPTAEA